MTVILPAYNQRFELKFDNGNVAQAVRIQSAVDVVSAVQQLAIDGKHPVIFVSGGAGGMSEADRHRTRDIIAGICHFAVEHNAIIVDGGTESGIMQMIGDVRQRETTKLTLIGVSPLGKISYPGYKNPNEEAFLEDSHSHFILVDGDDWGSESRTIVDLADNLSGELPAVGVLINGGKIAMHEVYLASTHKHKIPIIVLEGSGRAADDISTAFRTGTASQAILMAILKGGDIQLVSTDAGPEGVLEKLRAKFKLDPS